MPSLLQQLDNNEAILLMYLADELPSEDRIEVEQMLASDPGMRIEFNKLQEAHQKVVAGLGALDKGAAIPVSESAALRQVSRVMKQWHIDCFTREPEPVAVHKELRFPWWAYPLACAASVLIAILVWWGMKPETLDPTPPQDQVAEQQQSFPFGNPELREKAMRAEYSMMDDTNGSLVDAEHQAYALGGSEDDSSAAIVVDPIQ